MAGKDGRGLRHRQRLARGKDGPLAHAATAKPRCQQDDGEAFGCRSARLRDYFQGVPPGSPFGDSFVRRASPLHSSPGKLGRSVCGRGSHFEYPKEEWDVELRNFADRPSIAGSAKRQVFVGLFHQTAAVLWIGRIVVPRSRWRNRFVGVPPEGAFGRGAAGESWTADDSRDGAGDGGNSVYRHRTDRGDAGANLLRVAEQACVYDTRTPEPPRSHGWPG